MKMPGEVNSYGTAPGGFAENSNSVYVAGAANGQSEGRKWCVLAARRFLWALN
jgi:hypothetical protein